jgi:hypothetical protein
MSVGDTIVERTCRQCRHFRNDAQYLERAFPGLTSMSSGYASVRAEDGICLKHDRYLNVESSCPQFSGIAESEILPATSATANPSPPRGGERQLSSYFSSLIAAARRSLLSDVPEVVGVPAMTDLPHEVNGLEPPSVANWLMAFGTALIALIMIGILPHFWG